MGDLDTREWLLTNGLGSFASGTVSDARTRTYHGWLIAALAPPSQRTLLLSHLDASLEVANEVVALSTNFWGTGIVEPAGYKLLRNFEVEPVPTWIWGEGSWQIRRQLVMPYGLAEGQESRGGGEQGKEVLLHRVLIQYCYEGSEEATLRLRPAIGDRDFHHQQKAEPDLQFSQLIGSDYVCLQAIRLGQLGTSWYLRWTQGEYQADAFWYWNYCLPEETRRGLGDREDLYSPGYLTVNLKPGASVTLEARVGLPTSQSLSATEFEQAIHAEQQRLSHIYRLGEFLSRGAGEQRSRGDLGELGENYQLPITNYQSKIQNPKSKLWLQLLRAGDRFIVYRQSIAGPTAIAGYPWFNDWGRDTLIALPGLALKTQRFDLAKGLLRTFGRYCRYGLIPNAFPDADGEPFYNSIDATLWWIETLGLYLEATQDWNFLAEQYPTVQQIYKAFTAGTKFNIQVDAADELVSWNDDKVALTWMDAVVGGRPITPRCGKPVEINALWYSALCWASEWAERLSHQVANADRLSNQARRYAQQAQRVKASLQKFWNPTISYLYDTIEPDDRPNSQIRPNAVLALSLHHCGFTPTQGQKVLQLARARLLTPYGLRSLDPADLAYIGSYAGSSQYRDRAYHQGTVWTWLIGPFIRAWKRFYPSEPLPFDWKPLIDHFQRQACIGSISEIFDGDAPHSPQGAIAQAWSVAEVVRHFEEIQDQI